jgi:hypothetical protein
MTHTVQIWKGMFLLCGVLLVSRPNTFAQNIVEPKSSASTSTRCIDAEVSAKPTRPNLAYSTDTTQCGVVEADYGWSAQWPGDGSRQNSLSSSVRFGITRSLDVRWGGDNFVSVNGGASAAQGTGDNWLGARYRFREQTAHAPTLALSYTVKVPTASPAKGFGSGYADHGVTLLASKDIQKYHFDFNLVSTWLGSQNGFENSTVGVLACWRPLTKRLSIVGESHGGSQAGLSPYASILVGAAYSVNSRFVLDTAFENAVTSGAPQKRFLLGATYAIGNAYSRMARPALRP